MLWAAWFCVCTPLVSHLFLTLRVLRATCDSALVSPFSPTLVARLPTAWLPLSRSTLWVLWAAWVYTCLLCSGCFEQPAPVPSLSPSPGLCAGSTLSKLGAWFSAFEERCGCFGPPDSRLISHLSPVCCRCPGPEWLALRVLWAPWFCSCLPLVSQYAVDALSCMVLHLSPTCPALVSDCLAVCFGFSGPPDSTLVSRLFPTVSQHAVGALGNMSLHLVMVMGQKIKRYKAEFIYIYILYLCLAWALSI